MTSSGSGGDPRTGSGGLDGLLAVDVEQEQVSQFGCELVNRLFVLVRNALLFDLHNEALNRPIEAFLGKLAELPAIQESRASIGIVGDNLFLNEGLLKPDPGTYENSRFLGRIFQRLKAREMRFDGGCSEPELRAFLAALRRVVDGLEDQAALTELQSFELIPLSEEDAAGDDVEVDRRIRVLRVFAGAITVMARAMAGLSRGQTPRGSLIRRVAYDLVEVVATEPDLLLGLLLLPVTEGRLGAHLVRVAALASLCATRLGLPRRLQAEVALISLYHHFTRPAEEAYRREEDASADLDRPVTTEDPLEAALALCAQGGLNEALIRRVVGVYEATAMVSGERRIYREPAPADLLGRIVLLADRYASLLATVKPDEALRLLIHEREPDEPDLCRLFVSTVGLYPVGTVVQLSSGARAVVVEVPRARRNLLRPMVQIVGDAGGGLVDLAAPDSGHGEIIATLDPLEDNLNVAHVFLL